MKENEHDFYNNEKNIKRYGEAIDEVGLWDSERIIFHKYIDKNSNILDVGCGAGRTTINLFKDGYKDIIGLDIAENLIDYAINYCQTNNLNVDFILGDATNIPFPDNSMDAVIFSYNGMQCIPKKSARDKVLKEINRILPLAFFRYPLGICFTNIQDRESRTIKKHYILCSVFQKITNCRHVQIEI